jgi:hypothetical protein
MEDEDESLKLLECEYVRNAGDVDESERTVIQRSWTEINSEEVDVAVIEWRELFLTPPIFRDWRRNGMQGEILASYQHSPVLYVNDMLTLALLRVDTPVQDCLSQLLVRHILGKYCYRYHLNVKSLDMNSCVERTSQH